MQGQWTVYRWCLGERGIINLDKKLCSYSVRPQRARKWGWKPIFTQRLFGNLVHSRVLKFTRFSVRFVRVYKQLLLWSITLVNMAARNGNYSRDLQLQFDMKLPIFHNFETIFFHHFYGRYFCNISTAILYPEFRFWFLTLVHN